MELNSVRLRTYRQVWSQERVIYQVEKVRLPFPVSFRQAGVFAVTVALMALVSGMPVVSATSPVLRYLILPGGVTWFLTKQRLDGKPPLRWLFSMLRFAVSPKRLNRLRPITQQPERLRFSGAVGYRLKG